MKESAQSETESHGKRGPSKNRESGGLIHHSYSEADELRKRMSVEFREEIEKISGALGGGKKKDAAGEVEAELESIFGVAGKDVLVHEFADRYQVTLGDAIRRPGAFHTALYYLLGDLWSGFVMERINSRVTSLAGTADKR